MDYDDDCFLIASCFLGGVKILKVIPLMVNAPMIQL